MRVPPVMRMNISESAALLKVFCPGRPGMAVSLPPEALTPSSLAVTWISPPLMVTAQALQAFVALLDGDKAAVDGKRAVCVNAVVSGLNQVGAVMEMHGTVAVQGVVGGIYVEAAAGDHKFGPGFEPFGAVGRVGGIGGRSSRGPHSARVPSAPGVICVALGVDAGVLAAAAGNQGKVAPSMRSTVSA